MTDQPENWERINLKSAVIFGRNHGEDYSEVRFSGPDREANAKLFLRAQMMDELLEAAERARRFIENEYACPESQALEGEYVSVHARPVFNELCDIIAKIEGTR